MEKKDYRENLERLIQLFPDRVTISVAEAAKVMHVNINSVYNSMKLVRNPLPSVKVGTKRRMIPIMGLARWLST